MFEPFPESRHRLFLLGFGLEFPADMTRRTETALASSDVVFSLPKLDLSEISSARVVDLSRHYAIDRVRDESYSAMADEVLAATREHRVTSFLTYGHSSVGSKTSRYIRERAGAFQVVIETVNAPSSIETVCGILGIDPFQGLTVIEANSLLKPGRDVSSTAKQDWLFTMQVPYVGTTTATHSLTVRRNDEAALRDLQVLLVEAYGPEHPAFFVRAAVLGYAESVKKIELRHLVAETPLNSATLAIPPIGYEHASTMS